MVGSVTEAGTSPTRKSAAMEGHRRCMLFGRDGLTSACCLRVRNPEMMNRPGQRSPWEENSRRALASRATRACAKPASRVHRADRPQASSPTGLDLDILAERYGKHAEQGGALNR